MVLLFFIRLFGFVLAGDAVGQADTHTQKGRNNNIKKKFYLNNKKWCGLLLVGKRSLVNIIDDQMREGKKQRCQMTFSNLEGKNLEGKPPLSILLRYMK